MTTNDVQTEPPKIPVGFHAFLLADLRIQDPGQGHVLDVIFKDGRRLRTRASAEVLRLGTKLNRHYRATLHFRTDKEGTLQEPLHLYRVRPISVPLNHPSGTYWSATGLVTQQLDALVILPEKARTPPFKIHFLSEGSESEWRMARQPVRASGSIVNRQLVATEIVTLPRLDIPHHHLAWQRWL